MIRILHEKGSYAGERYTTRKSVSCFFRNVTRKSDIDLNRSRVYKHPILKDRSDGLRWRKHRVMLSVESTVPRLSSVMRINANVCDYISGKVNDLANAKTLSHMISELPTEIKYKIMEYCDIEQVWHLMQIDPVFMKRKLEISNHADCLCAISQLTMRDNDSVWFGETKPSQLSNNGLRQLLLTSGKYSLRSKNITTVYKLDNFIAGAVPCAELIETKSNLLESMKKFQMETVMGLAPIYYLVNENGNFAASQKVFTTENLLQRWKYSTRITSKNIIVNIWKESVNWHETVTFIANPQIDASVDTFNWHLEFTHILVKNPEFFFTEGKCKTVHLIERDVSVIVDDEHRETMGYLFRNRSTIFRNSIQKQRLNDLIPSTEFISDVIAMVPDSLNREANAVEDLIYHDTRCWSCYHARTLFSPDLAVNDPFFEQNVSIIYILLNDVLSISNIDSATEHRHSQVLYNRFWDYATICCTARLTNIGRNDTAKSCKQTLSTYRQAESWCEPTFGIIQPLLLPSYVNIAISNRKSH